MKLSVIVPVYRVEDTLSRCVDSVLGQSFSDYELILVDDGSPDGSGAICDDYASHHPHVRVIHKANGGLSSARNAGIDVAQGEYITFIDSDDFIGENTLSILMSRLEAHPDHDILEYPVYWHFGGKDAIMLKFGVNTYDNMRDYWLRGRAYSHSYACNKVFVRSLFDHVRFVEGRKFEDVHTLPLLLEHARRICTTEEGIYYYTSNPNGITNNPGADGLRDLLEAHVNQLHRLGLTNHLTEYYAHVLNVQLDAYSATCDAPILPTPPLTSSSIRGLGMGVKTRAKLRMLQLIGIKNLCKLHRLIHPSRSRL